MPSSVQITRWQSIFVFKVGEQRTRIRRLLINNKTLGISGDASRLVYCYVSGDKARSGINHVLAERKNTISGTPVTP